MVQRHLNDADNDALLIVFDKYKVGDQSLRATQTLALKQNKHEYAGNLRRWWLERIAAAVAIKHVA